MPGQDVLDPAFERVPPEFVESFRRTAGSANVKRQFPHEGRVPHISLVFREMWDTTAPSL